MNIQAIALACLNGHILVIDNRVFVDGLTLWGFANLNAAMKLEVQRTGINSIVAVGTTRRNRIESGQEGSAIIAVLNTIDVNEVHIIGCASGHGSIVANLDVGFCRLVNWLGHVGNILLVTGAHCDSHQQQ